MSVNYRHYVVGPDALKECWSYPVEFLSFTCKQFSVQDAATTCNYTQQPLTESGSAQDDVAINATCIWGHKVLTKPLKLCKLH